MQAFWLIRYYNFIVYSENKFIKDVEELNKQISDLEEKIIRRLYEFKTLNPLTKDLNKDIEIIKPILNSRIMNLENISIKLIKNEQDIEVDVYDGEVQELGYNVEREDVVPIKNKKKIKLFIK